MAFASNGNEQKSSSLETKIDSVLDNGDMSPDVKSALTALQTYISQNDGNVTIEQANDFVKQYLKEQSPNSLDRVTAKGFADYLPTDSKTLNAAEKAVFNSNPVFGLQC